MKYLNFLLIIPLFATLGCKEESFLTYTEESGTLPGIYFQGIASYTLGTGQVTYRDSTVYSFAGLNEETQSTTLNIPVKIFGMLPKNNSPFKVKVVAENSETTAKEGIDFIIKYDECIFPGEQATAYVPVVLLRTPTLLQTPLRIKIELEENEYFRLPIKEYKATNVWNAGSREIDALHYVIRFSEQYREPFYWSIFGEDYWGVWTPEKFRVVNEVAGWTPADWERAGSPGSKIALGRFDYVARAVQSYLQKMADAGTPIKDADGSNMQQPEPYAVIYN